MFEYHASVFSVDAWRYTCKINMSSRYMVCILYVHLIWMAWGCDNRLKWCNIHNLNVLKLSCTSKLTNNIAVQLCSSFRFTWRISKYCFTMSATPTFSVFRSGRAMTRIFGCFDYGRKNHWILEVINVVFYRWDALLEEKPSSYLGLECHHGHTQYYVYFIFNYTNIF